MAIPDLFGAGAGATLSGDERYRYVLWRVWNPDQPSLLWVMLNPSTADASDDDPTIRRCMGFSAHLGYGGLRVVNLFAWRATDPRDLGLADDPVGPDNDRHIEAEARKSGKVIVAWGSATQGAGRDVQVLRILRRSRRQVFALSTTSTGHPGHPLYLPKSARPVLFCG
ncbi:MAG: DUF1643 domain-containing protein [Maricaulis maris]